MASKKPNPFAKTAADKDKTKRKKRPGPTPGTAAAKRGLAKGGRTSPKK